MTTPHDSNPNTDQLGAPASTPVEPALSKDALRELAKVVVPRVRGFIQTTVDVASGEDPDASISLLVLALSDILNAGAHLGASPDVVPPKRFEPDLEETLNLDPLREALRKTFQQLDNYTEVVDPIVGDESDTAEISSDVATIVESLSHGLQHYDAGNQVEALWWWQYSYISSWGERASSVLRVLQLILMHLRLDVPDDVAEEARYEALFAPES